MQILPIFRPAFPPALLLRQLPGGRQDAGLPADAADAAVARREPTAKLVCAQCGHPITADVWRISVAGSHHHVFANPHGQVFAIECFATAPGCAAVGPVSPEFSWFPGTCWQVAVCAACGLHLGWRYEGDDGGIFFGLIPDRLQRQSENLA